MLLEAKIGCKAGYRDLAVRPLRGDNEPRNASSIFVNFWLLKLTTEESKRVLIDPYLTDNPMAPLGPEKIPSVDLIIVNHAAFDHLRDALYLAKRDNACLVCDYLVRQLDTKVYHENRG
jgi:glyoxylase-like metal-dependent hydrolase (beta-lactamase superfamily II)